MVNSLHLILHRYHHNNEEGRIFQLLKFLFESLLFNSILEALVSSNIRYIEKKTRDVTVFAHYNIGPHNTRAHNLNPGFRVPLHAAHVTLLDCLSLGYFDHLVACCSTAIRPTQNIVKCRRRMSCLHMQGDFSFCELGHHNHKTTSTIDCPAHDTRNCKDTKHSHHHNPIACSLSFTSSKKIA